MKYREEMLANEDSFDGCAGEMLKLILPICRGYGEKQVLLTCLSHHVISDP